MATIPQKELRNNIGEVLRRAEAGEAITITVAGREVARLGPTSQLQWVGGSPLQAVWHTPALETPDADLDRYPSTVDDPFERRRAGAVGHLGADWRLRPGRRAAAISVASLADFTLAS